MSARSEGSAERTRRSVAVDPNRFSRLLYWTVAGPIAALSLLAGLLAWEVTHLLSLSRWVDHSSHVIGDARTVERLLVGLEAGVHGYLLSGDAPFLEPWTDAERGIGPALEALADDITGDPNEAKRVDAFRTSMTAWMQEAQRAIDTSDRNRGAMERRKGQMDILRGQLGTILQAELSTRALREQVAEAGASLALGASLIATLLVGVGIAMLSRRHMLRLSDLYESAITTRELVLQSVGDGIYGVDRDGRITFMNPAGAALLGRDVADVLGRDGHALFHHSTADGQPYAVERCPILAAFRDGAVHRVEDEVFWRKDGSSFPVAYVSTPIRHPGPFASTLAGAVVSFHDVSRQRAAQAERQRLLEQAHEGVRARDHVLGVAAHELRTPLMSLKMQVELLAKIAHQDGSTIPAAEVRRKADACTRAVHRMERIVDELLDAARVHASRVEVHRERVDLAHVGRRCVADLAPEAEAAGCKVTLDVDGAIVGEWDTSKVVRIVRTLVSNALVYGKGAPVDVTVRDEGARAVLDVRDRGAGIRDADRERIFSPLEHADIALRAHGLGLGLYCARGLAQAMGGDVVLANAADSGATFRLVLPK